MTSLQFFVAGIPVPKGSGRAFYNKRAQKAYVVQDNSERQKPWASDISYQAQQRGAVLIDGPVSLRLKFFMPRPKNHFGAKGLKPTAPKYPISRTGDIDKLTRLVLDALTNIAYADDSQVVGTAVTKEFSQMPGVEITIWEVCE